MSQQPSGWYDDPLNAENLRYWDGVTWTDHTTPKVSPSAAQSTIGRAPQVPAPGEQSGQAPGMTGNGPFPVYPAMPQDTSWMNPTGVTPDGVPMAPYGKRFLAWLMDGLLITVISTTLGWKWLSQLPDLLRPYMNSATVSLREANDMALLIVREMAPVTVIQIMVGLVYCVGFWTWRGQTPGKMALGISVRLFDRPGPLPVGTALLRRFVVIVMAMVPLGGFIALLDGLWPLWDDRKQTLHDKAAKTCVVQGPQPPRDR